MILFCGFLYAAIAAAEVAGDVALKMSRAAEYMVQHADRPSLVLYEEVLAAQPENRDALWNAAYLHIRLGWLDNDSSNQRRHFEKAHEYATQIFRRDPDSYDAHLIMGAATAKRAEFVGKGEKVRTARELEQHARFLLARRLDVPDVWYLYGWWHYELSRVSASDRFFASLLFGGLPTGASIEQAVECLQKAIALRADYCAYYPRPWGLFYEKSGHPSKASQMYRAAIAIPPKVPEDSIYIEKARERLAKLAP